MNRLHVDQYFRLVGALTQDECRRHQDVAHRIVDVVNNGPIPSEHAEVFQHLVKRGIIKKFPWMWCGEGRPRRGGGGKGWTSDPARIPFSVMDPDHPLEEYAVTIINPSQRQTPTNIPKHVTRLMYAHLEYNKQYVFSSRIVS